ncbi:MAG: ligase-associated DNA damage response endonuclease PdeM [Planctomycetes bacterium]|nr:ligase-associated DNA damage response endonuclease PdeM [Planctomycetota bacterium]
MAVRGHTFSLLHHRAAYWQEARTLLVADLHLGKADALRGLGAALPAAAILDSQLRQLDAAIAAADVARVLILGDLLHAPIGTTPDVIDRVAAWRQRHASLCVSLVPGNHDRCITDAAHAWRIDLLEATHREGPFVFSHYPDLVEGAFVWAGHLHPAVSLRAGADRLKLPCFHVGPDVAVLPAFSRFTAGGPVRCSAGERVFVIADAHVRELAAKL